MSSITFDTHKFVKKLRSKDISEEQSEAIVDMMLNMQQSVFEKTITKPEAAQSMSELKYDISRLSNA